MPRLLKRLELSGFKSFAQRTVLEFPEGITAIVGPNGSGKSNVVDAIRWLLGERDAKNLRGGKVEDLIFAGTPKKPRMGQAHATLYFENHDGFFPVDFNEVAITRQVNREGTSQYFLNKAEILLRDLVDFYAKARLGARGLVVITQGNSDLFIQATPLGRREMIEEILGLREYQLKKSEAQRRLKSSQSNFEKVRALAEEILPHLRSLKRQTGRWERRGVLEEELTAMENGFFGIQWHELSQHIAEVERQIVEHQKALGGLQELKTKAETRQSEVEASQPQERSQLNELKTETRSLLEKRGRLEKEIGRLEAKLELESGNANGEAMPPAGQLAQSLRKIEQLLKEALNGGVDNLAAAVRASLQEIQSAFRPTHPETKKFPADPKLQADLNAISRELSELDASLSALRAKETQLEQGQEAFYQHFKEAVAAVEEAKDQLERWEARQRQQEFEKERLTIRFEELKRQIEQAGRRTEEFGRFALEAPELQQDATAMQERIFKLRGELANMGEVDEALVKEARETEERYQFLNQQAQDLQKAQEDLRQLIKDLRSKISGEFDSALVRINKEFEKFFGLMFGGGQARLVIQTPKPKTAKKEEAEPAEEEVSSEDIEEPENHDEGVEIELKLPQKRVTSLEVLSGGERSLVGIAALFALISVSPPPFLVLDEIDAPLDERNARRFSEMLKEFSQQTQFVVVTHNRATMEAAHVLYGVTLEDDGTSKVLSLKLEQ